MADDPLDRDAEQTVAESLRNTPVPPMPDDVRRQLDAVLREEQQRREKRRGAEPGNPLLGLFGPDLVVSGKAAGPRRSPRTIRA